MRHPLSIPLAALLMMMLVVTGCEPGPRDLNYGEEECAYCMMRVTDRPFGSQLVTERGRNYAFDSVECLVAHVEEENVAPEDIHSIWVPNFADPEDDWLRAEDALYLQSEALASPMGLSLTAYADRSAAEVFQSEYGGEIYDWSEVRSVVRAAWLENSETMQHSHTH